jgi:hypothetical protein
VESFADSQPESSLGNLCASVEEILVHYHRIIKPAAPKAIEIASQAADRFHSFIQLSLEQPSSPLSLPSSVRHPAHPDLSEFDNLVGPLLFEARRCWGTRIPKNEYFFEPGSPCANW